MSRPRNQIPTYKLHKEDQARCWVNGKWIYLGKYGARESRAEFARIVAELDVSTAPEAVTGAADCTVETLILAFWKHAEQHYRRPDGTKTNEISEYRQSFKPLRRLYGPKLAKDFGPLALKAVRREMVKAGWARSLINRRVGRIRRAFKWAASEQLVPDAVYHSLGTVAGLQRGRAEAPETEPVKPVAWRHVRATLPHLGPTIVGMVRVQRLTGMRPGEVCCLRPADIDTSKRVWVFRPPYSKMSYKGQQREVMIGPRAQAVLRAFAPDDPNDYYFSPRRAVEQFHAERTINRKPPRYPSDARNRTRKSKGPKPAAKYATSSYDHAIRRAIERANWPLIEAAVEIELQIPNWHPNQLRHAHGTEVRKRHGLEGAQVALGHTRADVTQVYAERDASFAARIAAEMG